MKTNQAAEWLTRLCRVSPGHGDPVARAGVLKQVTDRAAEGGSEADVQLLAAASVLQVEDAARHGRDRVAGIAGVAAPGFRGDRPIGYAEYAAGCFLELAPAAEPGPAAPESADPTLSRTSAAIAATSAPPAGARVAFMWICCRGKRNG